MFFAESRAKKIISTFRERQSKGEVLSSHAPYGYRKPEDGSYSLVVDEEAANVIRQIYQWKVEGKSDIAIAHILNDRGISSPSKHKYLTGEWKNAKYNDSIWQRQAIKGITENEVYLGHRIYGKIQVSLYEGKRKSRVPRDQWTIIENDHEAIINQETFAGIHNTRLEVHEEFTARLEKNKHFKNKEHIFKDIAVCGDCKHKLLRRRQLNKGYISHYFLCSTYEDNSGYKCTRKQISELEMIDVAYEAIKIQINLVSSVEDILEKVKTKNKFQSENDRLVAEIRKVNTKLERINSLRSSLYDDYIEELLTVQEYLYAKGKYEKDETALIGRLNELLIEQRKYEVTYSNENKWLSAFKAFQNEKLLTGEMIVALIDTVELYGDRKVQINFKFIDDRKVLIDYINASGIEVKHNV